MKKLMSMCLLLACLAAGYLAADYGTEIWSAEAGRIWQTDTGETREKETEKEGEQPEEAAANTGNAHQTALQLNAISAVLIDGDSGRVLYGKNEKEQRPMASTTKIMTCILALETGNLEDTVTVSSYAASQPQVHLGASAGTEFALKDLLYSLMLESHNDSAVVIAEHIGGSVEGFADLMNQKARDIGCADTWFITPNGLDAEKEDENGETKVHSTTAEDLAKILRYCITQSPAREKFLEITRTPAYTFTDKTGKKTYSCTNHNALLTMMEGALTGKTGFTNNAGYSYVGAVEDEDRLFIVALLGCGWPPHKTYKWTDTRKLMEYAMENYEYENVWQDMELSPIPVENAVPPEGDLSVQTEVKVDVEKREEDLKILLKEGEKAKVQCQVEKQLTAPVRKGDVVGSVEYSLNGQIFGSYPIVAKEDVKQLTLSWCLEKVAASCLPWMEKTP